MVTAGQPARSTTLRQRVLIIVQNLPVPFDRRVWLECQTLIDGGYDVTVVCPRGKDPLPYEVIDGVTIHTYPPYAPGGGQLGFVVEYSCSFIATARLTSKARRRGTVRRHPGVQPAGHLLAAGSLVSVPGRVRGSSSTTTTCAQSSTSPGSRKAPLCCTAACCCSSAPHSTRRTASPPPTSPTRRVAVKRGGKRPEHVTVVRTGPDPSRLAAVPPTSRAAPRARPPRRLPRGDGPPGRRRPRIWAPPTSS